MRLEIVLGQEEDGTYSVHCPYFEVANEKSRRGIEQQPKSAVVEDVGMTEKRLLSVSGKQMVNTNRW